MGSAWAAELTAVLALQEVLPAGGGATGPKEAPCLGGAAGLQARP